MSEWQWNEVLIPYWKKAARFANDHGIHQIALEMHPGFCVYNPDSLLKLRGIVGDTIGANFDPSHLFWQNIDPVAAIRVLKGAIYHVHAKDTAIDAYRCAGRGILDLTPHPLAKERSWAFRTIGYGHDEMTWRNIFSELQAAGYTGIISIEHEDSFMTAKEGLDKAIEVLKRTIIFEK